MLEGTVRVVVTREVSRLAVGDGANLAVVDA